MKHSYDSKLAKDLVYYSLEEGRDGGDGGGVTINVDWSNLGFDWI